MSDPKKGNISVLRYQVPHKKEALFQQHLKGKRSKKQKLKLFTKNKKLRVEWRLKKGFGQREDRVHCDSESMKENGPVVLKQLTHCSGLRCQMLT